MSSQTASRRFRKTPKASPCCEATIRDLIVWGSVATVPGALFVGAIFATIFGLVLVAIVLVLKWLFVVLTLPLLGYVFHLSALDYMVATLCILVTWFSFEVMRNGVKIAVERVLNLAGVVCAVAILASAWVAIGLALKWLLQAGASS